MTTISDNATPGAEGAFEVYHVRSGIAYNGWFLVASVAPRADGGAQLETAFIVLDPQVDAPPRPLPPREVIGVGPGTPLRSLLDTQVSTALRSLHNLLGEWARRSSMPEPDAPEAEKVANGELRKLYRRTLPMPEDDPFRLLLLEGLDRLRKETRCVALRREMDTFMPAAIRVERD